MVRPVRILVRGRWCVVTRTGIIIGKHYSGPRLRRPLPLPMVDPLAKHRDALAGAAVVLLAAVALGSCAVRLLARS